MSEKQQATWVERKENEETVDRQEVESWLH